MKGEFSKSGRLVLALLLNFHLCRILADDPTTASISRRLAFPDFKDEERVGAITLLGSASIDRDSGVIRIPALQSQDLTNQAGRALYNFPLRMMDPDTKTTSSFHTTFSFRINKVMAGSNDSSDSGLTFLVVPDELTVGRNGGWLGMMNDACDDSYKPFAVEFDTFKNDEFADPNDNHVGINFGSIVSYQTADAASAGVSFRNGSTIRAWISYDSRKRWVDVRVGREGGDKPSQPLISAPLDLSKIFKEYMFVGFSAATGSTAQVHSILSWNFSSDSTGILRFPKDETCVKSLIPKRWRSRRAPSAFIIFSLVILIIILAFLNLACVPRKRAEGTPVVNLVRKKSRPRPLHRPRRFSLGEVLEATRVFSEGEVLGYGLRGLFFKGMLADASLVAIKRSSPHFLQLCSDQRKLLKEIGILAHLHHPNLVPLRGWCHDKGELLLIYEYMPNGSLDKWLFARGTLPWVRRYKVVREIANALAFLHSGWEKTVVHKDVRISNVLLDVTFRAKLGDFGLVHPTPESSRGPLGKGSCSSPGARLCLPPESGQTRRATTKMDVYCFGVMILEIVSGRDSREEEDLPAGEEGADLVEWAWIMHKEGRLLEVVDERLGATRYSQEQATSLLQIALLCTLVDPGARPSMEMVVRYVSGDASIPALPTARIYDKLMDEERQQQLNIQQLAPDHTTHLCDFRRCFVPHNIALAAPAPPPQVLLV